MPSVAEIPLLQHIAWRNTCRIIATRHPPIGVFDNIADPSDMDALFELEGLTNPRLRNERGEISLVEPARRISGPGSAVIMAAFTHLSPSGSRFSDGSHGVYYAGRGQQTAIAETVHHRNRFLSFTREPRCVLEMRCYLSDLVAPMHDLRGGYASLHDPDSYDASQRFARQLRAAGSNGLLYDSVRHRGGQCAAVFHPDCLGPARQGPALLYHWDGCRITHATVGGRIFEM